MKTLLNRPYPLSNARQRWYRVILFGLFVILFLQIFQPFGLDDVEAPLWPINLGYGFITALVIAIFSFLPEQIIPFWYEEHDWTVGREILITLVILFFIVLCNWIYSAELGFVPYTTEGFMLFVGFTMAVGVFPVAGGVLIRQNVLASQYSKRTDQFKDQVSGESSAKEKKTVAIYDQDGDFIMELPVEEILAVTNAENYVELYYLDEGELKQKLIRSTMSSMNNLLSDYSQFFRVHRSWIANLQRVERVEGNARGYDLFLHEELSQVPVSRSRIDAFEERMQSIS